MEAGGDDNAWTNKWKAEIDTSAPFQSVKEAVMLFGERVLAGEIYTNKLKQNESNETEPTTSKNTETTVTIELEETKQNLEKAKDERMLMASYLLSLQQELECTKKELQQLKEQKIEKALQLEPEVDEDIKHVEINADTRSYQVEFQKKKYATFGHSQPLAKTQGVPQGDHDAVLERHPSLRKKKKKSLIPLISLFFPRKKGNTSTPTHGAATKA